MARPLLGLDDAHGRLSIHIDALSMKLTRRASFRTEAERVVRIARLFALGGRIFFYNNGPSWAAAIAFYSLLSVFPLLLAAGSWFRNLSIPIGRFSKSPHSWETFCPKVGWPLRPSLRRRWREGARHAVFLPMVWTGTLFFGTLTKALNVAFGGFLLTYRFVPTRRPSWQAAFAGALIASAAFMVAKPVFLGYVQVLALDNFLYGSLGGIAAVIWAWVVSMIGIFGGQVASIWQAVMVEGESLDTVKRRHLPDLKRPFDQFEQRVAA